MKGIWLKGFIVIIVLQLSACSGIPKRNWPAQEGRVLDQETELPIEGALVVALWKGVGGYSHTMCFHVEITETDENGIYLIPSWRNESASVSTNNQRVEFVVYKEGYQEAQKGIDRIMYLEKHKSITGDRLIALKDYVRRAACGAPGENQKRKLIFHERLYEEALTVTQGNSSDDSSEIVRFLADIVNRQRNYK